MVGVHSRSKRHSYAKAIRRSYFPFLRATGTSAAPSLPHKCWAPNGDALTVAGGVNCGHEHIGGTDVNELTIKSATIQCPHIESHPSHLPWLLM